MLSSLKFAEIAVFCSFKTVALAVISSAVEALSWFDFTEHRWLNAPAGVVDDNLDPKPVYARLYDMIHRQWHTDADLTASSDGRCGTKVFCGTYEITVWHGGKKTTVTRDIHRESFYEGGGLERICIDL